VTWGSDKYLLATVFYLSMIASLGIKDNFCIIVQ
jgi:hypothetical protein